MSAPDNLLRHRTDTIQCPVRCHVTQPLGFRAGRPLESLSSCGTGQSGAAPDSPVPSDFCRYTVAHCSTMQSRPLRADSRCPLAHRIVRWHTGQSGEL
jgi:hypothetical protein